jgi:hypothetical protein
MLVRLLLLVTMIGAGAVVVYGLVFDRSGQALPFTVAGLFVLGVTMAITAVVLAMAAIDAGRQGRGIRATVGAFVGGLFAIGASGSLAGALIFGMLAAQAR